MYLRGDLYLLSKHAVNRVYQIIGAKYSGPEVERSVMRLYTGLYIYIGVRGIGR